MVPCSSTCARFCDRRFTPQVTTHRTYPMRVIVETLSRYNRLHPLPEVSSGVRKKFGVRIPTSTARRWISEFATYLPFLRLRDAARRHPTFPHTKQSSSTASSTGRCTTSSTTAPRPTSSLLATRQTKSSTRSATYLDSIPEACPHELFLKETPRASQAKNVFPVHDVRITERHDNIAVESARFALQSVAKNKLRHERVQEFMLVNDSATVAVEVPIVLTHDDVHHYRTKLGFDVPLPLARGDVYTGHIDLVQIRNGQVHILDYKPDATHIKPVEQLMIYALALARRSRMLLYHFRCAWFDDRNYFEFYPTPCGAPPWSVSSRDHFPCSERTKPRTANRPYAFPSDFVFLLFGTLRNDVPQVCSVSSCIQNYDCTEPFGTPFLCPAANPIPNIRNAPYPHQV